MIDDLRAATRQFHEGLEARFDAIQLLSDGMSRPETLRRYASFHLPADAVLGRALGHLPELEMDRRTRGHLLSPHVGDWAWVDFPEPSGVADALGMLYVVEGTSLGGNVILKRLRDRGADCAEFGFLHPYGADTGLMWKRFLSAASAEIGGDAEARAMACRGAVTAFRHAERVLCGDAH
ncbi:MAG: biliverdin-producing heme oxygenase [Mesorhizobium sp.]|nr:biliverdin-producing heme oxygenase [Mesorhizobium sp.]